MVARYPNSTNFNVQIVQKVLKKLKSTFKISKSAFQLTFKVTFEWLPVQGGDFRFNFRSLPVCPGRGVWLAIGTHVAAWLHRSQNATLNHAENAKKVGTPLFPARGIGWGRGVGVSKRSSRDATLGKYWSLRSAYSFTPEMGVKGDVLFLRIFWSCRI